jgi:hypothetical protein
MKTINSIVVMVMVVSLSSCINEKYIYKSNTIYEVQSLPAITDGGAPTTETNNILKHKPTKGFKAILSDKGEYLTIKPVAVQRFTTTTIPLTKPLVGWRAEIVDKKYFPELDFETSSKVPFKLKYFDTKPVLQALTVPLKMRPKLSDVALKDSFPSQAETGFNVGVAFGWKFTHNVYSPNKNIFGQNTNRFSISPGFFLGTGAADLKKSNTRNPVILFERKAAIFTTGGFFMIGFNSINLGYAFGSDFATGTGSKQWLYQGKMWHGIIFAIDILK